MIKITLHGIDPLRKHLLADHLGLFQAVVKYHGQALHRTMQRQAVFKGHWVGRGAKRKLVPPTGTTRRSIALRLQGGGLEAAVAPKTHYAPYLEHGTRYMSAQPFVWPALQIVKGSFIKDVVRVVRGNGGKQ